MPREEDLPGSKRTKLSNEITNETVNFQSFVRGQSFNTMNDSQKVNTLIDYINKNHAIYNLIIADLDERLKVMEKVS